ncbi:MAG: hypothetical protein COV72_08145 [Candidatus Omnitrophica bacterium CG11_big_fil_rev_8_21_14_0_20_42_13]|uniref:Restriction endonuclease n=1 Tax=Candidatus Ghiorseimicrobium undicola TaxID=1974746 RepID=A0A2H0LVQ0_9BACT|nr:MAG: hypothetical protein COV72_08145 [Candidatus Omnitrophica bacterium CG11_big_fil_rev_8_21_14_0_20_42_13]
MIISRKTDAECATFESLLNNGLSVIRSEAAKSDKRFCGLSSSDFEKEVYGSLVISAKNTEFEGTIQLITGHRFPDIVAKKYFGVEVKLTKQDHWRSTGNSVLETTRIEDVEKIYLFFGKLNTPPEFKFRKYEECLYDIAVTHSPRYLIDMELNIGDTIFDKMGTGYDVLRNSDNPIKEVVRYFRKIARKGEEPWWMGSEDDAEATLSPTVTLWSNLPEDKQNLFRNEAMARFPEIFGRNQTKYQNFAAWLAARHGVVDSSLRDRFTAGGQQSIEINGNVYRKIPKIFYYLQNNAKEIIALVSKLAVDEVHHYWGLSVYLKKDELVDKWVQLIIYYSRDILPKAEKFIVHLLGDAFGERGSPPSLKEAMDKYGLRY